jgi:prevent-host-death family protein
MRYFYRMKEKKTYSIMESQHNLAQVVREVEAGYEVEITRRKKRVARMVPPEEDDRVEFPDFAARAGGIWGQGWRGRSSNELVDEQRGER